MKVHNIVSVISAIVGLTVTVAAQGTRPGPKAPAKVQAKSVTITGCVAQGVDADHYRLTNAVRREQPPSSAATAGTSKQVGSDRVGASDRTGPYDLEGAEFKAHLGHEVEVTVTSGNAAETPGTTTSESATAIKPLPKLNVVSVKQLSVTCS